MNALAVPHAAVTDGLMPRGALQLARLVFTGLPLLRFFAGLGLLLIPVAVIGYHTYSPRFAFGIAIYLSIMSLGIPYIAAVPQLRRLLSNQRLGLLPGFAYTCGLLTLLLATLLAAALPLAVWVCGVPLPMSGIGMPIFAVATAYAVLTWAGMSIRHGMQLFMFLPLLALAALHFLNQRYPGWWLHPAVMFGSFGCSVAVWAGALLALRGRQRFSSMPAGMLQSSGTGTDYQQQLKFQPWLDQRNKLPSAETLLLGYAGDWRGRVQTLGFSMLLSPAVIAALVWFLGQDAKYPNAWLSSFLYCHLAVVAMFPIAWGELAARSRLLWLRHSGPRTSLWQFLESQLWRNYLLMFACSSTLVVLSLVAMEGNDSKRILLALLLALSASLHNGYYSVMVRVRHWGTWLQIVYVVALVAGMSGLVFKTHALLPGAWALLNAPILVVLTWVYRAVAQASFLQVDWLRLKPFMFLRNTAGV